MAISSLGAGSGVLTSDVIDKLKAADTAAMVTPIDKKISLQQQKGTALNLLSSLLTNFKSSANALGDSSLYQRRSVSGNTSAVSVAADAGVAVQSFSVSNVQMALNDVKESGSFSSTGSTIASGSGTINLTVGGLTYNIDYTASTTLDSLKESINNISGGSIKASTLQVGTNDYRLVLTSKQTGSAQAITLSDSTGGALDSKLLAYDATTNPVGMESIQAARDASFKYNGITMTRSTNTITDITPGMTLNLLQNQDSSSTANISIAQDTAAISDELNTFVQSYNSLTSQITSMTTSDTAAGTVGIFNGDNSVNSITREINQIITSISNNGFSLPQFGIDLNESGVMSFNSSVFTTKFNSDPAAAEAFLSGSRTVDANGNDIEIEGLFTTLNTTLDGYTKSTGIMKSMITGSDDALKMLNTNKTRAQDLLTARYDAMTARFVQYDSIMTQLTNQFSSLKQQITMAVNGTAN